MRILKNANVRGILVLGGVAVVTAAIGFATTAQLAAGQGSGQGAWQGKAVVDGQRGPGMMGRGMMGQWGPGGPGGPGRGPGGPGGPAGLPLRELGLTDAQLQQVRTIMESYRADQQAIGDRMRNARKALHDAIGAETFNESAIRDAAAGVGAVEADAAVLQAKIHAEVFALLTPEQAAKAKELRAEMEKRMKDDPGPGPGPGRGRGRGMRPHPAPSADFSPDGGVSEPETV